MMKRVLHAVQLAVPIGIITRPKIAKRSNLLGRSKTCATPDGGRTDLNPTSYSSKTCATWGERCISSLVLEEGQHRQIGTACGCCWPSSRTGFTLDAMPHVEHVFDVHDVGLAQFDPFLGSCWSSTSLFSTLFTGLLPCQGGERRIGELLRLNS